MIKIKNVKRVSNELVSYQLENDDEIVLSDNEVRKVEQEHEELYVLSINDKEYKTELSEVEYSDDSAKIIGFELV